MYYCTIEHEVFGAPACWSIILCYEIGIKIKIIKIRHLLFARRITPTNFIVIQLFRSAIHVPCQLGYNICSTNGKNHSISLSSTNYLYCCIITYSIIFWLCSLPSRFINTHSYILLYKIWDWCGFIYTSVKIPAQRFPTRIYYWYWIYHFGFVRKSFKFFEIQILRHSYQK